MFFVVFESTTPSEASSVSTTYYTKLQNVLYRFSGFINETPFGSVSQEDEGVLLASFQDEAAAQRWRNDPTNLRIQQASRNHIFSSYRVRVGNEIDRQDLVDSNQMADRTLMLISEPKVADCKSTMQMPQELHHVTGIIGVDSYENEDKFFHIVSWASEDAALDWKTSQSLVPNFEVICIRVARDYGKTDRTEAPTTTA